MSVGVNVGGNIFRFIYITAYWLLSLKISSFLVFNKIVIKSNIIIKQLNIIWEAPYIIVAFINHTLLIFSIISIHLSLNLLALALV